MTLSKVAHLEKGNLAEEIGTRFLQQQGLTILQRNFRCRRGELDIIARDGDTTVFVEVRYRKSNRYGYAEETVNRQKQQKLLLAAQMWLQTYQRTRHSPSRFDVVAISGKPETQNVRWIKNAFESICGY